MKVWDRLPGFADQKFLTARYWSNRELSRVASAFSGHIVNVSAWDDRDKAGGRYRDYFCNAASYSYTNFPGKMGLQSIDSEYELDLTGDVPPDLIGRFDVAFNHTTLEHIFEVRKAFRNICKLSRDIVIVVVPFAQVQHETDDWGDYWRITPTCMRALFKENGLEVVYESSNNAFNHAVYLMFVGARSAERWRGRLPSYVPISVAGSWIGRNLRCSARQLKRRVARLGRVARQGG